MMITIFEGMCIRLATWLARKTTAKQAAGDLTIWRLDELTSRPSQLRPAMISIVKLTQMSSKADNNAIDFVAFYLAKKINEEKTFKKMYIYKEKTQFRHQTESRQ